MNRKLIFYNPYLRLILPAIILFYDLLFLLANEIFAIKLTAAIFIAFLIGIPFAIWFKLKLDLAIPLIAKVLTTENLPRELKQKYEEFKKTISTPLIYQIICLGMLSMIAASRVFPDNVAGPLGYKSENILLLFLNGTILPQLLTFREYRDIYLLAKTMANL
jgi:hypothetical protein